MTGFERNADVVCLAAYAPLFARVGFTQWTPDLIFFNSHEVLLTPSYYVQRMFSHNVPDYTVAFSCVGCDGLYITAGVKDGRVIVKAVNCNPRPIKLELGCEGGEAERLTAHGEHCLTAHGEQHSRKILDMKNTMENKDCVVPVSESFVGGEYTLAPFSFTVLKYN